jgi:hypothetical protein
MFSRQGPRREFVSPYIGRGRSEKAFGGKSLRWKVLREKLGLLMVKSGGGGLKNIFANLCKSLEINGIFFGACPLKMQKEPRGSCGGCDLL